MSDYTSLIEDLRGVRHDGTGSGSLARRSAEAIVSLRAQLAEAVKALRAGECDCTVETMTQCGRCQFLAKHEEDKP